MQILQAKDINYIVCFQKYRDGQYIKKILEILIEATDEECSEREMYWREKLYDICGNFEIYTENLEYYEYEKGKLE
ncbi:hypothetical protein HMPREF9309_00516 [Campylobacter ureolyticus ACS-301-V-Sch3b]|uniref:Uncharacterized protein n=1 Tax=Campylobacter ureolyticus ACS-301-V-Sch3b TaxID=883165 RepID=S3XG86_9BACT|nr:hypothetical protein [Campylobacter ureolyticus]EPH09879.1 hypothetical protein HMPREF9309_00516 [Campylobacter ureolyticus ACS-301-V-Sch3b]